MLFRNIIILILFCIALLACNHVKNDRPQENAEEKTPEIERPQEPSSKAQGGVIKNSNKEEQINFDSLSIKDRARLLQENLPLLLGTQSNAHELYFKLFPDNFLVFTKFFGYYGAIDKYGLPEHYGILSESSDEYIIAFFDDLEVTVDDQANKLIGITEESTWQADGVNILQEYLMNFTDTNLELVLNKLTQRDEKSVKDFWYFLYSGPHPKSNEDHYSTLRVKVIEMTPSLVEALDESYNKLLQESDHP